MKYFVITFVAGILFLSLPVMAQNDVVDADDFLKDKKIDKVVDGSSLGNNEGGKSGNIDSSNAKSVEDTTKEISDIEKSINEAKLELENEDILKKKIELARKMHNIRPTRNQIDAAIVRAALSVPKSKRESFVSAMSMMINYNAIERISIDAMIETFTLKELEAMVDYYSKPEAISASRKTLMWAEKVHPEITIMIDKALMRMKTGQ